MKATARKVRLQRPGLIEGELAELGEECARVLLLLQQLAKARATGRHANTVLGELGAAILHLHLHTDGLEELIEQLN